MANFEIELNGIEEVMAVLSQIQEQRPHEVANALRAECEIEMTEAKKRTPVDTGALRASGHVQGPDEDGTVIMGFGGPAGSGNHGGETNKTDVGYAIEVHENEDAFHRVGEAKFLESTVLEALPYLAERVMARVELKREG